MRLILRTALKNLASHRVNSLLLGLIIAGGAMSLALATSLSANVSDPFKQTVRATNGADVHVFTFDSRADITPVARMSGVAEQSGPFEFASAELRGRPSNVSSTGGDRKSTRLNSSHHTTSRMPSSA